MRGRRTYGHFAEGCKKRALGKECRLVDRSLGFVLPANGGLFLDCFSIWGSFYFFEETNPKSVSRAIGKP